MALHTFRIYFATGGCRMTDIHNNEFKKNKGFKKKKILRAFLCIFLGISIPEINEVMWTFTMQYRELNNFSILFEIWYYPLNMVRLHCGFAHLMRMLRFQIPLKQPKCSSSLHLALSGALHRHQFPTLECVHSPASGNSWSWQGYPRFLGEAQPRFLVLQDRSEFMAHWNHPQPAHSKPQPYFKLLQHLRETGITTVRYFGLFPGVKLIQRCKPPWAMQILWAEQGIECNLSIYSSSIKQPFNLAGFVIQQTLLWSSLPKTGIWAWSEKFQVLLPQPVHKSTVPGCWARGALVYLRPCQSLPAIPELTQSPLTATSPALPGDGAPGTALLKSKCPLCCHLHG